MDLVLMAAHAGHAVEVWHDEPARQVRVLGWPMDETAKRTLATLPDRLLPEAVRLALAYVQLDGA